MHLFFSTPIWSSKIDNYNKINEDMSNYINTLQKNDPEGVIKSNLKFNSRFKLNRTFLSRSK